MVLVECLSRRTPGLWIPLAEVREETGWTTSESCAKYRSLLSTVRAAAKDGLIEFKSGEFHGRASVRLKSITLPSSHAGIGTEASP